MTLSQLFTPKDHQNSIDRYSKVLQGKIKSTLPNEDIKRKMQWHVEQYLAKTGELPE